MQNNKNPIDTAFKERIYTLIGSIPMGKVAAYGQLARLAGAPNQSRAVGRLLKNLPAKSTLPWHRVINSQGKISFSIESEKYQQQRKLLTAEGVIFKNNKVSLKTYQWLA
ncbi:DNA base-flipping protein [Pseudoalteromonas holothuriae]|uniref:DNA base-flipping protein n=1 Tax=Pseudoalteromonas holothuriae TaxID=2963714 RepID=A0A9W4R3D3_9GAMM|nr:MULTISPECIES: MGMT family protein [unclassified Pseudoalteromonas]CAH9065280.1 DNA base-flipping protein [Pseudoalteromonas sp. CIP111854]CAH9066465.1 DNA base-flipping protein [Pseudoalteromonas sp. CIP111951]